MNTPKAAANAILDDENKIDEVVVYPITLGRYALLELVDSPFINNNIEMTMANLLPSLYVMTHDRDDLKGITAKNIDKLTDKATEWADSVSLDSIPDLVRSILEKMQELLKVTPSTGKTEDDQKKM